MMKDDGVVFLGAKAPLGLAHVKNNSNQKNNQKVSKLQDSLDLIEEL